MHGVRERGRPLPLELARLAGPGRVVFAVDREERLFGRAVGRANGEKRARRMQRVEHTGSLVRDDERSGFRLAGAGEGEGDRRGQRRERHAGES